MSASRHHPTVLSLHLSRAAPLLAAAVLTVSQPHLVHAQVLAPSQETSDLVVYLGVMPAQLIRGHAPTHTEASMHGGAPPAGDQHIVVAVFDKASGTRIENAEVTAVVSGLGHLGTTRVRLEPMQIAGTVTYGGFVPMSGNDRYTIAVEIRRPGTGSPEAAQFTYMSQAP